MTTPDYIQATTNLKGVLDDGLPTHTSLVRQVQAKASALIDAIHNNDAELAESIALTVLDTADMALGSASIIEIAFNDFAAATALPRREN